MIVGMGFAMVLVDDNKKPAEAGFWLVAGVGFEPTTFRL